MERIIEFGKFLTGHDTETVEQLYNDWLTPTANSRQAEPLVRLQNTGQGKTIKYLQDCLHEKNIALDAMGFVWCDGGCEDGIYRYNDKELTEELLKKAEYNVKRMRTWFNNNNYRKGILST